MKRRDLSSNEENVEASPEPPMHKKHHELISAYTLAQKIASGSRLETEKEILLAKLSKL
jgi:hypothetical protein